MTIKNFEFKQQRMIRVEHKVTGRGLYRELQLGDPANKFYDRIAEKLATGRERYNKHHKIATWSDPRPGPHADPHLRKYWIGSYYVDAVFGFSDAYQMRNWFANISLIDGDLMNAGFHVAHLKSKHIIHGHRQAFATRKDDMETLGCYSINEVL